MKDHAPLFPIDGQILGLRGSRWQSRIVSTHASTHSDRILFKLLFLSLEEPPKAPISIDYWLSLAGLSVEPDVYVPAARDFLLGWLSLSSRGPEAHFYGDKFGAGQG